MEKPESKSVEQIMEYSLQNLFAAKEKGLIGYVELLASWEMVKLCDAEEFCKYLCKVGKPEIAEPLSSQILQLETDYKSANKDEGEQQLVFFPIIEHSDPFFQKRILEQFFTEAAKEKVYLQANILTNDQFDDIPSFKVEEQLEEEFEQDFRRAGGPIEAPYPNKKLKQQEKLQMPENIQLQNQEFQPQEKIEKKRTKQDQKFKFQLPRFFDLRYKAISTWMAINVTEDFRQELEEVKQMLKEQFMKKSGWVISTYVSFLKEFLIYRSILEGGYNVCQSEEQNAKKIEKLKQLCLKASNLKSFDAQEYQFLQYIFKNLQKQIDKDMIQKEITQPVRRICLQSLDKVYLTSNLNSKLYGNTLDGIILININHVKSDLNVEQLRQGPLRPYIALALYHEMAHYLVREYLQEQLSEFDSSFCTDKESIGKYFIETIKQLSRRTVAQSITLENDLKSKTQAGLRKFEENIERFQNYFKEFQKEILFFEDRNQVFNQIKETLEVLFFPYEFCLHKNGQYLKQKWNQIYTYIDFLNNDEQRNILDYEKERKYRLFFSLLFNDVIAQNWLEDSNQSYENWIASKQKLIKFKKQQALLQNYYFESDCGMDEIVQMTIGDIYNSINQDKEYMYKVQNYIEMILFKDSLIEMNQQVSSILQEAFGLNIQALGKSLERCKKRMTNITIKVREDIDIGFLTDLKLESLSVDKNLDDFMTILSTRQAILNSKEIIQKASLWRIMIQLPNFFTTNIGQKAFQSGYEIEKRLIGQAEISNIYTKDFDLMKKIDIPVYREQIGVEPKDSNQRKYNVNVAKEGKAKIMKIDIKEIGCGVYFRNQMNAKIRDFQKLKSEKAKRAANAVNVE